LGVLTTAALVSVVVVAVVVMITAVAVTREMAASRRPQLWLLQMVGTRPLMAHTVATTTATTLHRRLHQIWLR